MPEMSLCCATTACVTTSIGPFLPPVGLLFLHTALTLLCPWCAAHVAAGRVSGTGDEQRQVAQTSNSKKLLLVFSNP